VIRFSDIVKNPVMDTATATSVGKVEAPVVDPALRRVVAFRVRRSKGPGDVLLWTSITGLGPDAVTVASVEAVADPPEELKARTRGKLDLIGRRVLSDRGHELGAVKDVEFDQTDGRITSLMLKDRYVEGERLLGIGSYAVVVKD
jgi:sporulation protein YlmC with PRC-barrel domain